MKKFLILLLVIIISIFTLTGCDSGPDGKTDSGKDVYYVIDGVTFVRLVASKWTNNFDVWVHKETRVMYIMFCTSGSYSMSALLNADGSPMIWEGDL
jgi:hypothetical protein